MCTQADEHACDLSTGAAPACLGGCEQEREFGIRTLADDLRQGRGVLNLQVASSGHATGKYFFFLNKQLGSI